MIFLAVHFMGCEVSLLHLCVCVCLWWCLCAYMYLYAYHDVFMKHLVFVAENRPKTTIFDAPRNVDCEISFFESQIWVPGIECRFQRGEIWNKRLQKPSKYVIISQIAIDGSIDQWNSNKSGFFGFNEARIHNILSLFWTFLGGFRVYSGRKLRLGVWHFGWWSQGAE